MLTKGTEITYTNKKKKTKNRFINIINVDSYDRTTYSFRFAFKIIIILYTNFQTIVES